MSRKIHINLNKSKDYSKYKIGGFELEKNEKEKFYFKTLEQDLSKITNCKINKEVYKNHIKLEYKGYLYV